MDHKINQLADGFKKILTIEQQDQAVYTSKMMIQFLKKLVILDEEFKLIIKKFEQTIADREPAGKREWENVRELLDSKVQTLSTQETAWISDSKDKIDRISSRDIVDKRAVFDRLTRCKAFLALIRSVENSVSVKSEYENVAKSQTKVFAMSLDDVFSSTEHFIQLAQDIDIAVRDGRKREISGKSAELYAKCRRAEKLLKEEISRLKKLVVANKNVLCEK